MDECRTKLCGGQECLERQENPGLRGGLVELCSRGGFLGVYPKSHNVPHQLGMGRLIRYKHG